MLVDARPSYGVICIAVRRVRESLEVAKVRGFGKELVFGF